MKTIARWICSLFKETAPPVPLIAIWTLFFGGLGLWLASSIAGMVDSAHEETAFRALGLTCLAAWMGGGLVGFLFGIPRVLQGNDPPDVSASSKRPYEQRVNTNLEQISDWLTKIIVGVGLVEMKDAPAYLWSVCTKMSQSFSVNGAVTPAVVPIICSAVLFFGVLGIIFGYLITRLFLASAFHDADQRTDLNRGFSQGEAEAEMSPLSSVNPEADVTTVSAYARRVLATLAKYQKEHFGNDVSKRWTFAILPGSPVYPDYLKAVGELLQAGWVVVSPETSQVMLSQEGLEWVSREGNGLENSSPILLG